MADEENKRSTVFACEQCRTGKRKCDGIKPRCSLCTRLGKDCTYAAERRSRKRKYWDEDYVHSLEQQIQTLLRVNEDLQRTIDSLEGFKHGFFEATSLSGRSDIDPALQGSVPAPVSFDFPVEQADGDAVDDTESTSRERSLAAMEDLSVMMWRANLGDGATVIQNEHVVQDEGSRIISMQSEDIKPPPEIIEYCQDSAVLENIGATFLHAINEEHQFTTYTSTDFLRSYPYQSLDKAFLHTAMLAVGASFLSARDDNMSRASHIFSKYAEKLMLECCRVKPTTTIVQGVSMLSFRSLAMGNDHMGWAFISMAGGLCVQLKLHVLAVGEKHSLLKPTTEQIRTFWMYYFVDKSAITILGRNCALPWRRVNVPEFDSTFETSTATVAEVSFAWQCRLWYAHDRVMDSIFAPSFEALSISRQVTQLISALEQLNGFYRTRPEQLDVTRNAPKPVLLFHLQYQMTILITVSPFLQTLASHTKAEGECVDSSSVLLVLRSITTAASEIIRLARSYRDTHTFDTAHPVIVHHLLGAGLVHLMNATSQNITLQRQSAHRLRICMQLLSELRGTWATRASKSIKVMRVLAQKWGVLGALPIHWSQPISTTTQAFNDIANLPASSGGEVTETGQLPVGELDDTRAVIAAELLQGFQELSGLVDLDWPFYQGPG